MREIIVDNFAGGGGASTGIEIAVGKSVDIAINHDPAAIAMHRVNHPETEHYCEDVWEVDPVAACAGRPVGLAWFSPDCKHHSKAKGGKPVDKNIRGLAWVAVKWAYMVRPRVMMLENVEEFQDWGPLGEDDKPIKERAGEIFQGFVLALTTGIPANHPAFGEMCEALHIGEDSDMAQTLTHGLGYKLDHRLLRACDYGAPTIRKRFFLIARCDGKPIIWPEPTHAEPGSLEVLAGLKKPWVPVADVIDFSLPCPSIFDTAEEIYEKYGVRAQRPLKEKTLARIARGIKKFVLDNPNPFIAQVNHGGDGFRGQAIDDPLDTITAKHGTGIVQPVLAPVMMVNNENAAGSSPQSPVNTITTGGHHMLIAPSLIQYHDEQGREEARGQSMTEPVRTIDASNRYGLVSAFISKYYGGVTGSGMEEPLPTVTTIDHNAMCTAYVTQFNNHCDGQDCRDPLNTITAGFNHFGEVRAFLVKYYSGEDNSAPADRPAPTITTRDRLGLVTVHGQDYQIVDIGLRMLIPRELFDANGFPHDYVIDVDADGNAYKKSDQVARCGNAVCPPIPAALVRANLPEMCMESCA